MRKLLLVLVAVFCVGIIAGQTAFRQKLSAIATIDFPAKPDFQDTLQQKVFRYTSDSAKYLAVVSDIGFDPAFKVKPGKINEVYDIIVQATLKATGGTLIGRKEIKIDSLDGIEIEYTSTTNPTLPDRRFKRIIFFNHTMYNYDFWTLSSFKDQTYNSREKFFGSFKVTTDKKNLRQYTDTAYQNGYAIGYYIIGPLLILAIIILIVYFAVRWSRR